MDCSSCFKHRVAAEHFASDAELAPRYQQAVERTLARLAKRPGRPSAMAPFESLFRDDWRVQELRAATKAGQPVVGSFCNFVPEELILAAGAIPLRLELGQAEAAEASAKLIPQDACPEVRSIVGAHLGKLPYFDATQLLVVPTACDGKKKLAPLLSDAREVHVLELPQSKSYDRAGAWHAEIASLAKRVERLSGRAIKRKPLRQAIALTNERTRLSRALHALRWQRPGILSSCDTFLVMHASFIADLRWWNEKTAALLAELEALPAGAQQPVAQRILLTGSPIFFPEYGILHLLDEAGAEVVADEMCSGTERLHHPTVIDEGSVRGMLRAAADRTYLPCTCPCFVSADDRIDRLFELAERSRAQGVVHHTLRLCHLYDMELLRVTSALKQRDLPLLNIVAEYGSEDSALVQNRLEAFLEMLAG